MMNPFKLAVDDFWLFLRIFFLMGLMAMYAIHWTRTYRISKAHNIVGMFTFLVMVVMLVVIGIDAENSKIISPFFSLALTISFGLDNWYFHNYQPFEAWLNREERQLGTFGLNTWLGKLLTQRKTPAPDEAEEGLKPRRGELLTWRNATFLLVFFTVFSLCFGFSRMMNQLSLRVAYEAQTEARMEQKTQVAIRRAVDQLSAEFIAKITPLTTTTSKLVSDMTTSTRTTHAKLDRNAGKVDKASAAARQAARKAELAARRSGPVILIAPLKPTLSRDPLSPSRVKAPPAAPPADTRPRRGSNRRAAVDPAPGPGEGVAGEMDQADRGEDW